MGFFKTATKTLIKGQKKAKKIERGPHKKPGRPSNIEMKNRKNKGDKEITKSAIKVSKLKKKRTANLQIGRKIPQENSVAYYNQMKRFSDELDKIKKNPTENEFIKRNAILKKYKVKDATGLKKKLKKAKAASEGQKTQAMMDFEARGGKTKPIVGKGKNPFMKRLIKRDRKLTAKELEESSKKDRFKPSPGSQADQDRRAEKARLKKIANNPLTPSARRKEALEESRALRYKKGGLIKRKRGGLIKPRGYGAARYKGSK